MPAAGMKFNVQSPEFSVQLFDFSASGAVADCRRWRRGKVFTKRRSWLTFLIFSSKGSWANFLRISKVMSWRKLPAEFNFVADRAIRR